MMLKILNAVRPGITYPEAPTPETLPSEPQLGPSIGHGLGGAVYHTADHANPQVDAIEVIKVPDMSFGDPDEILCSIKEEVANLIMVEQFVRWGKFEKAGQVSYYIFMKHIKGYTLDKFPLYIATKGKKEERAKVVDKVVEETTQKMLKYANDKWHLVHTYVSTF